MALSDLAIRNGKPTAAKAYKVRDGAGLFMFVTATGSKLWRLDYRFHEKHELCHLANTRK
jgi:hypothetical protein